MINSAGLTVTVEQFVGEWDILLEKGEITDQAVYQKWRGYLLGTVTINDFAGESTTDMNNGALSYYAYLRLWGFVGSGGPSAYIVDKYNIYGYTTSFLLTISVIPAIGNNYVLLAPPGNTYYNGDTVNLTAIPDSGFYFSGWSGDLEGLTNPVALDMTKDTQVTATFTAIGSTPTPGTPSPGTSVIGISSIVNSMVTMMIVVMMMKMMTGIMKSK